MKLQINLKNISTSSIKEARKRLSANDLVAIPTETVYGLAANAYSESAIKRIYETKQRPMHNPLILHFSDRKNMDEYATDIPEIAYRLADRFWPGPLTLVLKKAPHISSIITAGKDTVGLRIPDHPLTLELLHKLDFPLVAPSANASNHISPTSPEHVKRSLGSKAPYILDGGQCKNGLESTIIGFDGEKPIIYRYGAIGQEELEEFLGNTLDAITSSSAPLAPGMLSKHYSPKTKLVLTNDIAEVLSMHPKKRIGILSFGSTDQFGESFPIKNLSVTGDVSEAASRLFSSLYELEEMDLELIVAGFVPNVGVGRSINDRLLRASNSN